MKYHSFTITVGVEFSKGGLKISKAAQKLANKLAAEAILSRFGGFTVREGIGAWKDGEGKVVSEKCLSYEVCVLQQFEIGSEIDNSIKRIASLIRQYFNQECVVISYNSGTSIIH